MTKKEIEMFKDELKYYVWLQDTIKRLTEKADELFYRMTGVKGMSHDKVPTRINESLKNEMQLELIEKYNSLIKDIEQYQNRLDYINRVLDAMSIYDRSMFIKKYEEGLTFQEVANQYYISKAGLFYRMQRALEGVEI